MNPIDGIIKFNIDRNLVKPNPEVSYRLLEEELQEFFMGTATQDKTKMADALCDLVVVAVGALYQLGYDPETALKETVKEVLSRQGSINPETGKWEKDRNQNPDTLYKADYTTAER
jgi:predicted HAD superfamily Cof-like phosphohydrolase